MDLKLSPENFTCLLSNLKRIGDEDLSFLMVSLEMQAPHLSSLFSFSCH